MCRMKNYDRIKVKLIPFHCKNVIITKLKVNLNVFRKTKLKLIASNLLKKLSSVSTERGN